MKLVVLVLSCLAVLFPCLLLVPSRWGFYADWVNHLWLIAYFGNYYRNHGSMPAVVNTPQIAGEPVAIFYGYLFYPLLGWLSSWMGPHGAVRLAVVGTLGLQFFVVQLVLRSLGSSRSLALASACLVTWATYPLTNLYNRSALTEFFAGAWLTSATCYWFCFLRAGTLRAMWAFGLGFALCSLLVAGIHPLTAWMGVCLSPVLVVGGLLASRGDHLRLRLLILSGIGLGTILCLAPWLYATARFQRDFAITASPLLLAVSGIDQWAIRFFPLPLDMRCVWQNPLELRTPYLDAQVNVPLLVLVAVCLVQMIVSGTRRPRALDVSILVLTGAYLGLCVLLSLYPVGPFHDLPKPFKMVQYTYRWVNQINLALLICLCMVLLVRARSGPAMPPRRFGGIFLGCLLTWAGVGVVVKLEHAYFIYQAFYAKVNYRLQADQRADLPPTYYGKGDYSTPALYAAVRSTNPRISGHFNVDSAAAYGTPQPLRIVADRPSTLVTSVEAFPWNKLYVDGHAVSPQVQGMLQAIPVAPGEHVVVYRFEPDRLWAGLTRLSKLAFATILLACIVSFADRLVAATRSRRPAGSPVILLAGKRHQESIPSADGGQLSRSNATCN
jgi:hypothetical protein